MRRWFSILTLVLAVHAGRAADLLFDDPILVKARSFQIRESDLQDAFLAQKAAAVAVGQPPPPRLEAQLKRQILEKMIATRILLARAMPVDKENGQKMAQRIIADNREKAGSEASYRRRLLAVGTSPEKFEAEIQEQAVVQAVIDRELKAKVLLTPADIKKYYDDNISAFSEPEKARVAHILFAIRRIPDGELFPPDQRQAKKATAERIYGQIRGGEDFMRMLKMYSDDPDVEKNKGELTFTRGSGAVPGQFEAAAFSLKPGQMSDLVVSVFGYHIIKLIEKIPAGPIPLDKVQDRIRETVLRERVQEQLPDFLAKLREEAGVEVLQP